MMQHEGTSDASVVLLDFPAFKTFSVFSVDTSYERVSITARFSHGSVSSLVPTFLFCHL
uniref:Macaca fascicularis brain cDNA, clone: QtrA-16834 n=1 Tax=Macaca fascicularis TaxID=9541 RepID=I7GKQ1_MACFA|nr:unnamed protein product [Macaca fascicularis]